MLQLGAIRGSVHHIFFSNDSQRLVASSIRGRFTVFDLTDKKKRSVSEPESFAFRGPILINDNDVVCCEQHRLTCVSLQSKTVDDLQIEGLSEPNWFWACSTRPCILFNSRRQLGTIDIQMRKVVRAIDLREDESYPFPRVSRDGHYLLWNRNAGSTTVTTPSPRYEIRRVDDLEVVSVLEDLENVWPSAFCFESQLLISATMNSLQFWDISSRKCISECKIDRKSWSHPMLVPGGQHAIAFRMDGLVYLISTSTGAITATYDFGVDRATALAVSPDGLTAAVGGSRGKVAVFDLEY